MSLRLVDGRGTTRPEISRAPSTLHVGRLARFSRVRKRDAQPARRMLSPSDARRENLPACSCARAFDHQYLIDERAMPSSLFLRFGDTPRYMGSRCEGRRMVDQTRFPGEASTREPGYGRFAVGSRP